LLGAIVKPLLAVLFDTKQNVSQQLQGLACLSHILLYLYRKNKTGFIPGQLYHDLQATIRCAFVTVAQGGHFSPEELLHVFDLGSDNVEQEFAVVRTLTHARTCDVKEFAQRVSHATQLNDTWAKHPEWKRAGVRLNEGTADHMNHTTWAAGGEGNASVKGVDLVSCWKVGRRNAVRA
ncbi:unnamed protein product, partial [Scytosiphon promiscuus]